MSNTTEGTNEAVGGILFDESEDATAGQPRPLTHVVTVEEVAPYIAGTNDELFDFALAHIAGDKGEALAHAIDRLTNALYVDCAAVESLTPDFAQYRSKLVRLAARATALLALDEMRRGDDTTERAMERLDDFGYLKS